MPEKITDSSIAWLLMAIHFAAPEESDGEVPEAYHKMISPEDVLMKKYKNVLEIIFMGDFINRSIFTEHELIHGIDFLLDKGLIEDKDGYLITTKEFLPAYNETAKKMKHKKKRMSLEVIRELIREINK
jgi:hypothetical protein